MSYRITYKRSPRVQIPLRTVIRAPKENIKEKQRSFQKEAQRPNSTWTFVLKEKHN